ncbi:MAG: copper resistance protein CopC, partial [Solirubrobacterales bacterium]|nr:copper resistance protein CopC [Solirubrobacterales bacterium]
MSGRRSIVAFAAVCAAALVAPGAAGAHAYLIRTTPPASGVLDSSPKDVALTYDEAVEPRFAIISVTDVRGHQLTSGAVRRSPANPDTLLVPLRANLPQGWYLIYWRAISVDGHPVQGAFTYAVGPNPGPPPKFHVPSISATSTTAQLLITRWLMFVGVMFSIGLYVLRFLILRPVAKRVQGVSLRGV